jgi:hypothetical protein
MATFQWIREVHIHGNVRCGSLMGKHHGKKNVRFGRTLQKEDSDGQVGKRFKGLRCFIGKKNVFDLKKNPWQFVTTLK